MLRDLLSNRWFQGGFAFCVLIVGGSLLYSWHLDRTTESDMERHDRFLQRVKQNEKRPTETVNVPTGTETLGHVAMPEENANPPMSDATEALPNKTENFDFGDAFLPDEIVSEEDPDEEVPVSPFGFGPYPELPEGWPTDTFPAPSADHELMARVEIKLLSQGVNVTGSNMENGMIYPAIKGTAYVKWKEYDRPDGTVRYISDIISTGEDGVRLHALRLKKGKSLTVEDIPSDIKLVSFQDGGINPYQFLDLP